MRPPRKREQWVPWGRVFARRPAAQRGRPGPGAPVEPGLRGCRSRARHRAAPGGGRHRSRDRSSPKIRAAADASAVGAVGWSGLLGSGS